MSRHVLTAIFCFILSPALAQDAKNQKTDTPKPPQDPALEAFGIYEKTAPHPDEASPVTTALPLALKKNDRVVFIGNTLFDRGASFPHFESFLHLAHPDLALTSRTLAWSADEVDLMPRPDNFGDIHQHLTAHKADVIFAAFGYNESFAGPDGIESFRTRLTTLVQKLKTSAYNGETAPRIVLVSPVANENITNVPAADLNNANLEAYTAVIRDVAAAEKVAFADVFAATGTAMANPATDLTINGAHLTDDGYAHFADTLFRATFKNSPPDQDPELVALLADKNAQFFRRYRPLNTFYYTGGRNKSYGYLDFLPAMRNFDLMVAERERAAHARAKGDLANATVDDSDLPELGPVIESRGANEWLNPADELAAFNIDPRVEVNLFASEEEFPEIACPVQIRWDASGRLWVACSTTYPHVYPGEKPNDKIVILEDTDGDGKADKSSVFADDVHIPLSFELGDGGVYVSEEPHFAFLKDTDDDGKADLRRNILTGFGTEDSHHALHDFVWTPDGDLLFRESIFHNSQVETPYGPIRAKNSAWFRFSTQNQKLLTFGAYPNTNPWGVTFTHWGHHIASHPIFASAFHATNPPYPKQHPKASGIPAYSGVAGHEFIDFPNWPEEFQGKMVKARYKPTNRIELLDWTEQPDHFAEDHEADLIFSTNLSFIPVDLRFGPDGGLYVCDWYNPVKGHAQYSLRDPRRDRRSGRIWRITPKSGLLADPPKIADQPIPALLKILERPEYRVRYWAKRELRTHDAEAIKPAVDAWLADLDPNTPDFRHHQLEALWLYHSIGHENPALLAELAGSAHHLARAAATAMLRHGDPRNLLPDLATDKSALVRMEAAIAASYIGTPQALDAIVPALDSANSTHVAYATATALGSENLSRHWQNPDHPHRDTISEFLATYTKRSKPAPTARDHRQVAFDAQKNLKKVRISCIPERLLFDKTEFTVTAGQPVRLTLKNPDATQHNLVITLPGAGDEIGMAGNEMAKSPEGIKKHFIPDSDKILHHTKLLDPDTSETLRFKAPTKPGAYPYVCTFPGHWILMRGTMHVTP